MAREMILIDTSILIDHFRKTDKTNSVLISLVRRKYIYSISAITDFEIYTGAKLGQLEYWNSFLLKTPVLPFDKNCAKVAIDIDKQLKKKSKRIAIPDLFIAATALGNNLAVATLNKKHFERVEGLTIVD